MKGAKRQGASRGGAPFNINLDRVSVSHEAVEGVLTCVQDFVRDMMFTQKSFISDSGIAKLKDAVAVADSVIVSDEFNLWSVFADGCNQKVVSDLQSCQEKVVLRRKASQDTNERWFGAPSAGVTSASSSAGRGGVCIFNVVSEGLVEKVTVPEPTASLSLSVKNPVIGSKKNATFFRQMSPKTFEVVSPVSSPRKSYKDDPSFGTALDRDTFGSHRKSGRDRRALPVFHSPKKK